MSEAFPHFAPTLLILLSFKIFNLLFFNKEKAKMIKALIFDFDYTLGDSTEGIIKSAEHALYRLSEKEKTRQEIKNTIGLSLEETYKTLTGNSDKERALLFKKYFIEKADEVMVDSAEFYKDTLLVLESIKEKGYKTAIVTTKLNSRIQSILGKFSATFLIDVIVGVENVKNVKPHPEGLFLALEKLGVNKEEAVYIGDSFVDALASQNAEIPFIGVLTGTTDREEFKKYKSIKICKDIKEAYNFVINNREEK